MGLVYIVKGPGDCLTGYVEWDAPIGVPGIVHLEAALPPVRCEQLEDSPGQAQVVVVDFVFERDDVHLVFSKVG
ncbi:hypothetical protein HYALB_00012889 [Hymenoscyphus albidus]|uniref:Uncharacterized protein n=1 Tax=Hymenoscyphus albidus TaxID=595503 RepID=A0A9N9LPR6_9HELO|nr:hypothetical protein HYALB_00012889 [Hymenoscyphus albidus]